MKCWSLRAALRAAWWGAGGCEGWQLSGSLQQISDLCSWLLSLGAASSGREKEPAAPAQPWTLPGPVALAAAFTAASLLDVIVTASLVPSHLLPDITEWESKGSRRKEVPRFSKAIHHTCPSCSEQFSRQEPVNVVYVWHVETHITSPIRECL